MTTHSKDTAEKLVRFQHLQRGAYLNIFLYILLLGGQKYSMIKLGIIKIIMYIHIKSNSHYIMKHLAHLTFFTLPANKYLDFLFFLNGIILV